MKVLARASYYFQVNIELPLRLTIFILNRFFATEMFKIHRGLSPEILRETFVPQTSSHNLRRNDTFEKRRVHSV